MEAKIRDREAQGRLTSEQVWRQIAEASFAVLSHVTPSGEPRSSGVVYRTLGRRLYVAVAPDSWKARHVAVDGSVSLTVPVRRGGVLALVMPIPPATVSFHGHAIVHPAGSPAVGPLLDELGSLLPADRRHSAAIIEIVPEGRFVTYGIGVPLTGMRDPTGARACVPVS
jgi:hypothetical protein